jgi:hypothetical protein
MKKTIYGSICAALALTLIPAPQSLAARKNQSAEPAVELSEAGQQLEARYVREIDTLKNEVKKALPALSDQQKAGYQAALAAEADAKKALNEAETNFGAIKRGEGLVAHAKGKWIGGAEKAMAAAEQKLAAAGNDEERAAARKELEAARKNREEGEQALKERQAQLDQALKDEPRLTKELQEARQALELAKAATLKALASLGLDAILHSDKLDGLLAKHELMVEATTQGLAAYAQQGSDKQAALDKLLSDDALIIRMMIADGPNGGKAGEAMDIYTAILKQSAKAKSGVLNNLALAIALEHAVPIEQRNEEASAGAPAIVDPVGRYLHYETAYLNGELDPGFGQQSVYNLRMVADGNEPNETLTWGREMLNTYRPDQVTDKDYRWRYVGAVRSDIRYGSQYNKYDKPELHFFQNILMNGGICGRRAFYGRFMLRAFGVPTTARPQPGHAALTHWTPDGWVICLGAGWGAGTTKTRYKKDLDFLANTQARAVESAYPAVKRAQWIGRVVGETPVYGLAERNAPGFWYGVALHTQRAIIDASQQEALAAVGEDIGEANETKEKIELAEVTLTKEDKTVTVADNGTITIPAAACSNPTRSTGKIIFMDSKLGGKQLHYSRNGEQVSFEYTFEAPKAGKYMLSARIANPSWGQILRVQVNGSDKIVDIDLPLTVALWGQTDPVEINLDQGKNILTFSRGGDNIRGLSIKDFTLKPL